ncbi:hypothetical protein [Saccharibacillus qingshengii]|uniref:hypothetical protein n=1 Tax=Saccharibacillus qingshengii TaxID=1763540 RepID=UPI001555A60F|nr:hypothetical protein [Saccharibacillus qingshengii]
MITASSSGWIVEVNSLTNGSCPQIWILDRAAQIVPLQAGEGSSELSSYRDRAKVADWAKSSAQAVLAAGLAEGSGGWLRPLETLSRAESAAVAQRLLQQANLIDQ